MNGTIEELKKDILIVDDCEDNLYLMQLFLETQGYKVEVANSGKQALLKIDRARPRLILLDLMMPQMNGYEVMDRIRNQPCLASIPVLFVTANKYVGEREAIAAGARGVIHKPIDLDTLLLEVAKSFGIKATY